MSLFGATVAQVVKDVGDEDVIAVNDRNTADYCKIFSLVVRKQHFWRLPWASKFDYVPTEISLLDILEEVKYGLLKYYVLQCWSRWTDMNYK